MTERKNDLEGLTSSETIATDGEDADIGDGTKLMRCAGIDIEEVVFVA